MSHFILTTGIYEIQGTINGTVEGVFNPTYLVAPIFADPGVTFDTVTVSINGLSNYISAATAIDFNYPGSTGGAYGGTFTFPISDQQRTINVTVTDDFSAYPFNASATPGVVATAVDMPDGLSIAAFADPLSIIATPLPATIWLFAAALLFLIRGIRPTASCSSTA